MSHLVIGLAFIAGELSGAAPRGWVESEAPTTRAERLCANYSQSWSVELSDTGEVEVAAQVRQEYEISVPLFGGRLEGTDGGEWGGELRWRPATGVPSERVLAKNVHAILPVEDGTAALVLTGLAHISFNSGAVYRITPQGSSVAVVRVASLGRAPQAVAPERQGTFLVLTSDGVLRVSAAGAVENVCAVDFSGLNAYSIASQDPSQIFVGMGRYVAEVHVTSAAACTVTWYVRADCERAEVRDLSCACVGQH